MNKKPTRVATEITLTSLQDGSWSWDIFFADIAHDVGGTSPTLREALVKVRIVALGEEGE